MKKAERPAMSTKMPDRGYDRQSEVQYEVSAKGDVINLTIQKEDRILSISTNPQSGLLLASDILSAVDTTTNHTIGD